jgi:hypothetical protein
MVVPGSGEAGSLRDRIFAQRAADNASQFRVATGEWPVKFRDPRTEVSVSTIDEVNGSACHK